MAREGSGGGSGRGTLLGADEFGQALHRVEDLAVALVFLRGLDPELLVNCQRELQRIDRIEAQAFDEERRLRLNVFRLDVLQHEGLHDQVLELELERCLRLFHSPGLGQESQELRAPFEGAPLPHRAACG